jgi:plasmanylethanolamine desaturase
LLNDLQIRQRDRHALREGYSRAVRRFEIASIAAYAVVMTWLAVELAPRMLAKPFLSLSALMLGFVAADFVSGFVHWLADTWGTPEWPIVGKTLIRPFREHHVDPKEITRHDFIETNGNNCFICVPAAALAALLPLHQSLWLFLAAMTFALCLAILGTNQFHKWAHMDEPPRLVRLLQRAGLILPPAHHAVHHQPPYARYHCITVGWLNEALFRLRFFQTLETLITRATGLLPREDDLGRHAAEAVAREPLPPLPRIALDLQLDAPETAAQPELKPD